MILTHAHGVRLTQSPDPPAGVTRSLGQDPTAVDGGFLMHKQARSLGPPGTLERSVASVPLHTIVPEKSAPTPHPSRPFSLWFCVISLLV